MKLARKIAVGFAAAATITSVTAISAGATTVPADSGWDNVVDTIVGQGSDTTYRVFSDLANLYNQANGCDVQTSDVTVSSTIVAPFSGDCKITGQTSAYTGGNWDHDLVVNKYPVGSGQGITEMRSGRVDFARSSRAPKSTETGVTAWAYAKDGLGVLALGGRAPQDLSTATLKGIYNCSITNWADVPGSPENLSGDRTHTIYPFGMQTSSGTYAVFNSFLTFDPNAGSCVQKLSTGAYPFENDVKQLEGSVAQLPAGVVLADSIWWGSFAELKTYSYKRQSADYDTLDGVALSNATVANNSYGLKRFVYHITPTASVGLSSGAFTGATAGKAGAVRALTTWLCKPSAAHITSDYTGVSNYTIASSIITNSGFQRVPTAERTTGTVCNVAAV